MQETILSVLSNKKKSEKGKKEEELELVVPPPYRTRWGWRKNTTDLDRSFELQEIRLLQEDVFGVKTK